MGGYQLEEIFNFRNFVIYVLILMIIYEVIWLFLVVMDFFFKSISSAISGKPVKDFEAAEYIKYGIIFNIIFLLRDVITKKKGSGGQARKEHSENGTNEKEIFGSL